MSNMEINFSIPSPTSKNNEIKVYVENFNKEDLLYKFIIGCDGVWDTIEDFTEKTIQFGNQIRMVSTYLWYKPRRKIVQNPSIMLLEQIILLGS